MTIPRGAAFAAGMAVMLIASVPAQAQHSPWGPSWGSPGWSNPAGSRLPDRRYRDQREGRVEVSRFVVAGPAAEALGHGPVTVESESGDGPWFAETQRAAYEAAIVDALVGAGYDTQHPSDVQAQVARLRISRHVLVPAEEKKSPVSGSAAVSVGTHGSAYGLAVNVDMTKPRAALVSTRLDARIADKATGKVLWEGYATIATREGDDDWSESRIAGKLASALFDNFPQGEEIEPLGTSLD
ncbi:DUF4136 domain-containing protein [Novosphingobium mangrovi (ex Huang et al. 2023)]|uniref:DUF4136 domain-containing protein n=1 Tax=Novosphingobium mangrovi (ex Huang et al. 2023) TaxID=2976432 RepID=A0ABT2IA11_9SPHN|nr:DUF4136 domain-containing protein [Novosphingobium mangrovi (ex Huang et al. 2023)]MCT2401664.1 DUF4136 domain-containing protein [Novosphingobium mangrovi (ex Huang et al. 2023)]